MSTRTNIVIINGQSRVYMYRHSDGYLGECGADLILKLEAAWGTPKAHHSPEGTADRFLRALFAEYYEQQSYEISPRKVYELTTEMHGDIEHVYYVEFKAPQTDDKAEPCFFIRHAKRPTDWSIEDWELQHQTKRYSVESFRAAVNKDRAEMNARIAELRKESTVYANCTDYAMV